MTAPSPRDTLQAALDGIAALAALSPNHPDFIAWRKNTLAAVKDAFGLEEARVFNDIPFYEFKKVMGFYAKQYSPEAYANGLARCRAFLEKKLAALE